MKHVNQGDSQQPASFILNHEWHSSIIGILVSILMICIYLWIVSGFIDLLRHLYVSVLSDWTHGAEIMIKDVVIILAALELIRTLQSYLSLGRVRVTFILDAALVVLIGELISLWYGDYVISEVFVNVTVTSVLVVLRIITARYSPDLSEENNSAII